MTIFDVNFLKVRLLCKKYYRIEKEYEQKN